MKSKSDNVLGCGIMYQHMMLMNISNDLTTLVKKVGNLAVAVLVSL